MLSIRGIRRIRGMGVRRRSVGLKRMGWDGMFRGEWKREGRLAVGMRMDCHGVVTLYCVLANDMLVTPLIWFRYSAILHRVRCVCHLC
jgi:hypothetical protein